jgi:HK97 family phage prohead protease
VGYTVVENHPQATRPFAVVDDATRALLGSHPTRAAALAHVRLIDLAPPGEALTFQVEKSGMLSSVRFGVPWLEEVRLVEPTAKGLDRLASSEAEAAFLELYVKQYEPDGGGLGVIEGYSSVFSIRDMVGDRMLKGCYGDQPFTVPYLAFHDQTRPVGSALSTPDDYGLKSLAALAATQAAAEFLELVKAGAIPAQSIGYAVPPGGGVPNEFGGEDVSRAQVLETSGVPIACNQLALITAAKHYGALATKSWAVPAWGPHRTRKDVASPRLASPGGSAPPVVKGGRPDVNPKTKSIEGSLEDQIEDISDALRSQYPGSYVGVRATFPDRAVYTIYNPGALTGDDDEDGGGGDTGPQTYMASYVVDQDGDITFGMPVAVEIQEVVTPKALLRLQRKEIARVLTKAGARHSKRDQGMIQDIHDAAAALGAACPADTEDQADDDSAEKALQRLRRKAAGGDDSWDAAANEKNLGDDPSAAQLKAMYALPGDTKSDSKLPHHNVSSSGKVGAANTKACSAAIAALNGGRGGVDVSDSARKTAYNHLAAHIRAAGGDPPELKAFEGMSVKAMELELDAVLAGLEG